jgi:cell division protein FtsW
MTVERFISLYLCIGRNGAARSQRSMARTLKSDKMLFWAALALVSTSVVMVISAAAVSREIGAVKQIGFALVGLMGMFAMMRTDYHHLKRPAVIWTLLIVTFVGLVAVFMFAPRNNAQRWIHGPISMQPSEVAKLVAIVFAAAILERRMHRVNDIRYSLGAIAVVTGLMALLIAKEPDLGTAVVVVLVVFSIVFAAGLHWRYVAAGFVALLPVLTYYIVTADWRQMRILAFLHPLDPAFAPYTHQLRQSQIALGSGGPGGLGLGGSMQKAYFLPEAHNDFIFAIIGEELGLIGTTALVMCFLLLVWRGLRVALLAPDRFGTLVGIGIAMMVGMQALINMSVVTGIAPTKGIPLPLVSAGGSSLLITMVAMGILLNISQQASSTAAASVNAR